MDIDKILVICDKAATCSNSSECGHGVVHLVEGRNFCMRERCGDGYENGMCIPWIDPNRDWDE